MSFWARFGRNTTPRSMLRRVMLPIWYATRDARRPFATACVCWIRRSSVCDSAGSQVWNDKQHVCNESGTSVESTLRCSLLFRCHSTPRLSSMLAWFLVSSHRCVVNARKIRRETRTEKIALFVRRWNRKCSLAFHASNENIRYGRVLSASKGFLLFVAGFFFYFLKKTTIITLL